MKTWHRLVVLGVLALVVGTLFQQAEVKGYPLFRMFGTIGIALMGLWGAYSLARWQVESSGRALRQHVGYLRGVTKHDPARNWKSRDLRPESVLYAEDGTIYVIASTEVPNFRGKRHLRRVRAHAARLQEWVQEIRTGKAEIETIHKVPTRVVGILALLRREVRAEEDAAVEPYGVVAINVEQLHPDLLRTDPS